MGAIYDNVRQDLGVMSLNSPLSKMVDVLGQDSVNILLQFDYQKVRFVIYGFRF